MHFPARAIDGECQRGPAARILRGEQSDVSTFVTDRIERAEPSALRHRVEDLAAGVPGALAPHLPPRYEGRGSPHAAVVEAPDGAIAPRPEDMARAGVHSQAAAHAL